MEVSGEESVKIQADLAGNQKEFPIRYGRKFPLARHFILTSDIPSMFEIKRH
jgi:hypothetical protein